MKKHFVVGLLSLMMTIPAMAQQKAPEKRSPEQKAEMMTKKMTEHLDLTDDQAIAVKEANMELAAEMKANKAERKELMKAHDEKLKAILTDEQYEKLENTKGERRKKVKEMRQKRNQKME